VFFIQHIVIVYLPTLLLDLTLDILVIVTHPKWVVGIILKVSLKATLSVAFPVLSNVIAQRSTSARVYFRPQKRNWRWLSDRVRNVFNMFDVPQQKVFWSLGASGSV
jgi:hypothetical protein